MVEIPGLSRPIMGKDTITFELNAEVKERLFDIAGANNVPLSEVMRFAVDLFFKFIDNQEKQG